MSSVKRLRSYRGEGIDYNAYTPYRIMRNKLNRMKKKLSREIYEAVEPYMWETGYCKNSCAFDEKPRIMLRAYFFEFSEKKKREGEDSYKVGSINIIGFSENGVCLSAYAGGLAYQELNALAIEDLFKLHIWVLNRKEFIQTKK